MCLSGWLKGSCSRLSIRKILSIFLVCCFPVITTILVWTVYLDDSTESSRYTGYQVVLPSVSYTDLMRSFSTAHKPYSPDAGGDVGEGSAEQLVSTDMKINSVYSELSQELNTYLCDVCQKYAGNLFCNGIQLSPLLPLAEANLEGGRVDRSQTFSAMASTSVYTYSSVEELKEFDVTRVLDSRDTWLKMSSEYYTRDRGALQCNPNYGGNDPSYGPSERSLLDAYVAEHGMPDYGTNTDSRGNTFTVADWIEYSRTKFGDRFNVESMVRMFADEKASVEIPGIERNFSNIQNEYHVYAIMAYNHWIGSGFMTMDEDIAYAGFKTIGRAYEYCEAISSPRAIEIIYSQCLQDIQSARNSGGYPPRCLDTKGGYRVFNLLVDEGVCKDWDYYFRHKRTNGWDQGDTACTYALGVIYGVMQMNLLYSGY